MMTHACTHSHTHTDVHAKQGGDAPFVPGLADAHAGEQLGSSQVPEDRHPHLLLPPLLVAHVLEGGQGQQGGRGHREGGASGGRLLVLGRGAGGGKATFDPAETRPGRVVNGWKAVKQSRKILKNKNKTFLNVLNHSQSPVGIYTVYVSM